MSAALVHFEHKDRLAIITLDRANAANAVTPQFISDLTAAVEGAHSAAPGALLLRAEGPNFCAGADLKYFSDKLDRLVEELESMANGFHSALARLCDLPCPVIAAVQGNAVGAGFGLVLAADIVIAAHGARFSTGYARLGLSADAGVSLFLSRALGQRHARQLLMSARFVDASEAQALGLVDECVDEGVLEASAMASAQRYSKGPIEAYRSIKKLTAAALSSSELSVHLDLERDEILSLAKDPSVAASIRSLLGN